MTISTGMQALVGVLVALASYFIGNINSAILLSKLKGKDIRKCGSGNPGTMNMLRTFGKAIGALTFICDILKGVIPALLGWLFMGNGEFCALGANRIGLYVGGICAEIGHIYPVIMKFNGGKGIATLIGVCLVCKPVVMIISFAIGLLFLIFVKIGSLTSFIMLCAEFTLEGVMAATAPAGIAGSLLIFFMFALTLFAHRSNIVKLFSGNERRVVLFKSKKAPRGETDRTLLFDDVLIAE